MLTEAEEDRRIAQKGNVNSRKQYVMMATSSGANEGVVTPGAGCHYIRHMCSVATCQDSLLAAAAAN